MRKNRNLKGRAGTKIAELNFAGRANELWCEGGELRFLSDMIIESQAFKSNCRWFTSLVSNEDNLSPLKRTLKRVGARDWRVIEMAQGNKRSRILAWHY